MNNKNFAVGLFVAIALGAFLTATFWLTGKRGSEPTVNYSLYFEKNVSGLMLGGPVFYLGVKVGTSSSITIIPGNPMRVRVDISILGSAPVDAGTYASLALQGITGVAAINLSADPGSHQALSKGEGDEYPVIKVRDTGFSAIMSKAPQIVDRMDTVLIRVNEILGDENRAFVNGVLEDFASFASALASQEEAIAQMPVLINETLSEMQETLARIQSMVEGLEPELVSTVANLSQLTADLALISGRMEGWVSTNDEDMHAFMGDGLGQVPALVSDARRALRELEKLLIDLREDPSKIIYKPEEAAVTVEQNP